MSNANVTENTIRSIECVLVEAGAFLMGSEKGKGGRKVAIEQSFWIAKYPITNKQYGNSLQPNCPAVNLRWSDAEKFARKVGGFLPTEAQWEFAARGGTKSRNFIYSGSDEINEVGWYLDNSGNKTRPVGAKKPNELGIYDMSGNVWEWCADLFVTDFNAVEVKYKANYARVIRGGSFKSFADGCKVSHRNYCAPADSDWHIGFRVCFPYKKENPVQISLPAPVCAAVPEITPVSSLNVTENVPKKEKIPRKEKLVEKRHLAIIDLILENEAITTSQLAQILSVTRMTIHRDLIKLKSAGFISRGGGDKGGYWRTE